MNDYANYLREKSESCMAVFHKFRISYAKNVNSYHLFFEGHDDPLFYIPEAQRCAQNKDLITYICNGKSNVISIREMIKSTYGINFCLFFVDKDFNDFLCNQVNIDDYTYITDNYSIENDLATVESAAIYIEHIVKISRNESVFNFIQQSLSSGFKIFYQEIRPLMAWILACREMNYNINLSNAKNLKDVISLTGVRPKRIRSGFANFKKQVGVNNLSPSFSTVLKWRRELKNKAPKTWVRGKYDLWFMTVLLRACLEDAKGKHADDVKIKIPGSLSEQQLFQILGGRVKIPASLQAFFQRRLVD